MRLNGKVGRGITTLPLAEDRLPVAVPRDHPLAEVPRVRLRPLADEPPIMSSRQGSPAYFDFLTAVCQSHGFAPRVLHEVRSVMSQIAFVGRGQGVALVPSSMQKLASENVVIRPLKERVMVVIAALAWNPGRHHPMVDAVVSRAKRVGARSAARSQLLVG